MSYPNVLFGDYGDEKKTYTSATKGDMVLGMEMILPDGREYRFAKASATAVVVGKLYEQCVVSATDTMMSGSRIVAATTAVGATSITITASATTAIAATAFEDGYIYTSSSVGTGIGWIYKIKAAASAAVSSASVISLADNETVQVATEGGTTLVGLRQSEYCDILLTVGDTTGVGALAGVAAASCAASCYVWLQRKGMAAVFTDNTSPVIGLCVTASTTVAGAIAVMNLVPSDTTGDMVEKGNQVVGICSVAPADSSEYALVDLWID